MILIELSLSLQMVAGVNSANDVLLLGRLESLDSHYGSWILQDEIQSCALGWVTEIL